MTTKCARLAGCLGLGIVAWFGFGSGEAQADTRFIEAEAASFQGEGFLTPPLLLKDDKLASAGSYIEVAAGTNAKTSAPATGIATYAVFGEAGSGYRIWGRVIAPDKDSDSFYVRMNGGPWIRWNDIPLGTSWHWAKVIPDGSTQPAQFTLLEGDNTLQIAYREDGARLDVFVITNDTSFNPSSPPAGVPAMTTRTNVVEGKGAVRINWTTVPGAKSYKLLRRESFSESDYVTIASGLTSHTYTDTGLAAGPYCYNVIAVNSSGEGAPGGNCSQSSRLFHEVSYAGYLSLTSPMQFNTSTFTVSVKPGTANSLNAPPANGRVLTYFQAPVAAKVKVWGAVIAPNKEQDSFWVRMDTGPWIKWNEITPNTSCRNYDDVHDFDNGRKPVVFSLAAGSHTLEFAYREQGTALERVVVQDNLTTSPDCSD